MPTDVSRPERSVEYGISGHCPSIDGFWIEPSQKINIAPFDYDAAIPEGCGRISFAQSTHATKAATRVINLPCPSQIQTRSARSMRLGAASSAASKRCLFRFVRRRGCRLSSFLSMADDADAGLEDQQPCMSVIACFTTTHQSIHEEAWRSAPSSPRHTHSIRRRFHAAVGTTGPLENHPKG